jgi:hypothetical protein
MTESAPGELVKRSGAVVQATDLPGAEDDWLGRARNVLRPHNHAPAVLVEAGFLTNDGDRAFLGSEAGRRELALSIIHGRCRARGALGVALRYADTRFEANHVVPHRADQRAVGAETKRRVADVDRVSDDGRQT